MGLNGRTQVCMCSTYKSGPLPSTIRATESECLKMDMEFMNHVEAMT